METFRKYCENMSYYARQDLLSTLKKNMEEMSSDKNKVTTISDMPDRNIVIYFDKPPEDTFHNFGNVGNTIVLSSYSTPGKLEENFIIEFIFPSIKNGGRVRVGDKIIISNFDLKTKPGFDIFLKRIIQTIKKMVEDPEEYVLNKNIENIQHLRNPTKKQQERVIKELGPRGILLINNPDSELLKKYKNVKTLNKAGIL